LSRQWSWGSNPGRHNKHASEWAWLCCDHGSDTDPQIQVRCRQQYFIRCASRVAVLGVYLNRSCEKEMIINEFKLNLIMVDKSSLVTVEMLAQFKSPNEPVMESAIVNKLTRYNFVQTRVLVMTKEQVYIFDKTKLSRTYRIIDAIAVIKSSKSKEVVFVF
jgi:hypothetical protein